jgi:hypothetical protein
VEIEVALKEEGDDDIDDEELRNKRVLLAVDTRHTNIMHVAAEGERGLGNTNINACLEIRAPFVFCVIRSSCSCVLRRPLLATTQYIATTCDMGAMGDISCTTNRWSTGARRSTTHRRKDLTP